MFHYGVRIPATRGLPPLTLLHHPFNRAPLSRGSPLNILKRRPPCNTAQLCIYKKFTSVPYGQTATTVADMRTYSPDPLGTKPRQTSLSWLFPSGWRFCSYGASTPTGSALFVPCSARKRNDAVSVFFDPIPVGGEDRAQKKARNRNNARAHWIELLSVLAYLTNKLKN